MAGHCLAYLEMRRAAKATTVHPLSWPEVAALSDKKKWKLVGLDKALDGLPPEERASVAADIEEMFRDFDPENAPGEPVLRVEPGTRDCPSCGGALVELAILPRPDGEPRRELILECETCDATFSEPFDGEPS